MAVLAGLDSMLADVSFDAGLPNRLVPPSARMAPVTVHEELMLAAIFFGEFEFRDNWLTNHSAFVRRSNATPTGESAAEGGLLSRTSLGYAEFFAAYGRVVVPNQDSTFIGALGPSRPGHGLEKVPAEILEEAAKWAEALDSAQIRKVARLTGHNEASLLQEVMEDGHYVPDSWRPHIETANRLADDHEKKTKFLRTSRSFWTSLAESMAASSPQAAEAVAWCAAATQPAAMAHTLDSGLIMVPCPAEAAMLSFGMRLPDDPGAQCHVAFSALELRPLVRGIKPQVVVDAKDSQVMRRFRDATTTLTDDPTSHANRRAFDLALEHLLLDLRALSGVATLAPPPVCTVIADALLGGAINAAGIYWAIRHGVAVDQALFVLSYLDAARRGARGGSPTVRTDVPSISLAVTLS